MLQAMNTGHSGSMTTVHANSAQDVMFRLETLVLMGISMPIDAIRRQIAQALDLVVFLERLPSGRRMVTQITEVTGLDPTTGEVRTADILAARRASGHEMLISTGFLPRFLDHAVRMNAIDLDRWFQSTRPEESAT